MRPVAVCETGQFSASKSALAAAGALAVQNSAMDPGQGTPARSASDLLLAVGRSRNRAAFIALFRDYAPRVKSYLRRLGADNASAEDLVQDVMLTVWRRAETYDPAKASASTWIFTVARNRRIDVFRRQARPEFDPNDPALQPAPEVASDTRVEVKETGIRLRRAIAELPEQQAVLLRMAYFEDKSHTAMAEALELPLGTVKSRLRLAVIKLRATFEDDL